MISTETCRIDYNGAGTMGPFAVPFYFISDDHLKVIKTLISDGTATVLTRVTDYTVTGAGNPAGGSISTVANVDAGYRLTIVRDPPALQQVDYTVADAFPSESHERNVDRYVMLAQRVKEALNRVPMLPDGDASILSLPRKGLRAGGFLGFDADGNLLILGSGTPTPAYPYPAVAPDFAFTVTPNVNLVAGVPTSINLVPVPRGVNGNDVGHYIFLSAGSGTPETVLITGGTAVSGAAAGTIEFTPVNNHTGSWTITSASGGIQEAMIHAPAGGSVFIPSGDYLVRNTITVPAKNLAIFGTGIYNTRLTRTFNAGHMLNFLQTVDGVVNVDGLHLTSTVQVISHAMMNLDGFTYGRVSNIYMACNAGLFGGIWTDSPNATMFSNIVIRDVADSGLKITSVRTVTQGFYNNIAINATGTAKCVWMIGGPVFGMVGPEMSNIITQGGQYGFYIDTNAVNMNEGRLSNIITDSHTLFGMAFVGVTGGGNGWKVSGHLGSCPTGSCLRINDRWSNMQFSDLNYGSGDTINLPVVLLEGAVCVSISNSLIAGTGNGGANDVAIRIKEGAANNVLGVLGCNKIMLTGCIIGFDQFGRIGGAAINDANYGIQIAAGDHTAIHIENCRVAGVTAALEFAAAGAGSRIRLGSNCDFNLMARPAAAAMWRGAFWYTTSAGGVKDAYEICTKDAADAYAWRVIY